jgi:integrase
MPKFTDRSLAALKVEPGRKDRLLFDTECAGLGLRITTKGTKSFLVQWTDPATKRKVRQPIGVWGSITIEQARAAARARLGDVAKGIDLAAEQRRRREAAEAEKAERALLLDALFDRWGDLHLSKRSPRYASEAKRAIKYAFAANLNKPAARLARKDVVDLLDGLSRAGKSTVAARTAAYGRSCYTWAIKRGLVPLNPFDALPIATTTGERDRVLNEAELAEVWAAASALPYPFGPFFRLAILTLQRREEVAGMRWSELSADGTLWTIPAERMKNNRPHDVHLSPLARQILEAIPKRDKVDLVFTTTGKTPISGYSRAKIALDVAIVAARQKTAEEAGIEPSPLVPWRLHDIRRTGVSHLAALGFDSIVADKLLAHKPTKLKGVASIYQRHDFAAERKRTLEVWANHVEGQASRKNVVPFRAAGA